MIDGMTKCESCGFTDIRMPATDCPHCEYGQMQLTDD